MQPQNKSSKFFSNGNLSLYVLVKFVSKEGNILIGKKVLIRGTGKAVLMA